MAKKEKLRKGKYKVINWRTYNKDLKNRGNLTIWFTEEGIRKWLEEEVRIRGRGRQRTLLHKYLILLFTYFLGDTDRFRHS